ncbi:MAG: hypothetical protein AAB350_02360 [Patescibacteria group bacterium]
MNKNNFYISFGVWLVIIPLLGVPIVWRDALVFLSGLFLLLVSFGPAILRKLQSKPKVKTKKNNPPNPPYLKGEIKEKIEEREELKFSEAPSPSQGEGVGGEVGI